MVMFKGWASPTLIWGLRNWRGWLGDSTPMTPSTRGKLCTYVSEDTISGVAKLRSKLQNNDFCAMDAIET